MLGRCQIHNTKIVSKPVLPVRDAGRPKVGETGPGNASNETMNTRRGLRSMPDPSRFRPVIVPRSSGSLPSQKLSEQ
jgi:hypothetical protein